MATLSVLKFSTADGAQQMENTLLGLQKQQLITIQDAAIVTWPQGRSNPRPSSCTAWPEPGRCRAPLGHVVWLDILRAVLWAGGGRGDGRTDGKFADYGINDNFIKQMQDKVTEGTSALFLLTMAPRWTRWPTR